MCLQCRRCTHRPSQCDLHDSTNRLRGASSRPIQFRCDPLMMFCSSRQKVCVEARGTRPNVQAPGAQGLRGRSRPRGVHPPRSSFPGESARAASAGYDMRVVPGWWRLEQKRGVDHGTAIVAEESLSQVAGFSWRLTQRSARPLASLVTPAG